MKLRLFAIVAGVIFLASCKKTDVGNNNNNGGSGNPVPGISGNKVNDSAVAFSKDIYLWYSQIPTGFNGQSYTDPEKIMTAIRAYSTEPGFSNPVDRWSFAVKQQEWDNTSSGAAQDFGMNVFFRAEGDLRVRFVERSSPAGHAGIRRGWRITKFNGSSNVTTGNASAIVDAVYNSASTSFTFQKPDGSTVDINLSRASYQEHPVVFDSVYSTSSTKVGYMVFNSFLGDTAEIDSEFNRVFSRFASAGVQDVAIDLRYNGGGYVSVQEKLANYLINSSGNGQLMMKQQFNDKYTQYNESTYFQKRGPLNLNRIFFIVSSSTASASELVINNLKPYMNVILVGPSKTYGKPVGFFPIPVGDWYIFPVSFRSTNKNGEGNYFDGMALNSQAADGLDKDWGDVNESAFSSVLRYVTTGAFKTQSSEAIRMNAESAAGNKTLDAPFFKGAIETSRKYR